MVSYLLDQAPRLSADAVRHKVAQSHAALESELAGLGEDESRRNEGGWSIRDIVDHLAQTNIRAAEELRHLLAGRRPPAPPVYEGLLSGGARWAPLQDLVAGLLASNVELQKVIGASEQSGDRLVTANTIVVVNVQKQDGTMEHETFPLELEWRAYAMVQRLHAIDHGRSIRRLRALGSINTSRSATRPEASDEPS